MKSKRAGDGGRVLGARSQKSTRLAKEVERKEVKKVSDVWKLENEGSKLREFPLRN